MKYMSFVAGLLGIAVTGCESLPSHTHDQDAANHTHELHANKTVASGEGAVIANPFHPVKLLLSHGESQSDVTVFEFDLPPQSAGSPPHTHTLEDEYFYIVSGELNVLLGDETRVLKTGDFAAFTRGHTHMFWNGSEAPVKLIMTTTGSAFESFMSSVGPRLADAKPQDAAEAGAVIGQIAAEHGITISMEKMPAEAAGFYPK